MTKTVRAAGGVVVHRSAGDWLVLVTHRPHYNDWSIPKGKRDSGETDEACARREVLEETGVHVVMHMELPAAQYVDHKGRPKEVRYWLMTLDPSVHGVLDSPPEFVPNEEVDEARWLLPDAAVILLDYTHDQDLVQAALALVASW
jgi:8-oxo-dGTP diphosphatase